MTGLTAIKSNIQPSRHQLLQSLHNISMLAKVQRLSSSLLRERQPERDLVDRDNSFGAFQERPTDGTLANRAKTPDPYDIAFFDACIDYAVV